MIERYGRPEMRRIWTDEHRFRTWLEIELAVMEAWESLGEIPAGSAREVRARAEVKPARIAELEETTHHDVVAFVESVAEQIGPLSARFHLGLTSSDLLDTAGALQMRASLAILRESLLELQAVFAENARRYRGLVQIGRTHGIHAEPVSLGIKFCGFHAEVTRGIERLDRARAVISRGKISGAVGTYAHLSPALEEAVCAKLGLEPETVATQVVPRDRHAEFLCLIALVGAGLERFALEVRHLQRTEVGEIAEPFGRGQTGSSAMPHKQNPILSERICGLARVLRANAGAALENVALWHERDITHSSVERIILPDSTVLLDYIIRLSTRMFRGLRVFPAQMAANLERTGGLVFSQRLLSLLVGKGVPRPQAYRAVQRCALASLEGGRSFRELVAADPEAGARLDAGEIDAAFDPGYFLRYEDEIYRRAFGGGENPDGGS